LQQFALSQSEISLLSPFLLFSSHLSISYAISQRKLSKNVANFKF
jgi:hypothetical protein